ncbi:hypothetical protein ACIRF8_06115 [Streptomyces sp. NPDC102406]|uniref:hypothetical protein n=1 Tax=Streptomyces sp. NPDC102406 TaxID=3366171 RepID=UPI0038099F0A
MTAPRAAATPIASDVVALDLDETGLLRHPDSGRLIEDDAELPELLRQTLRVPDTATDLLVFVHGWMTPPEEALRRVQRLLALTGDLWDGRGSRYGRLPGALRLLPVALRWQSATRYREARARAGDATLQGQAAHVLAALLGYLDERRTPPRPDASLRLPGGQYLHCVGHSFGCRFLCQALPEAGPAATARRPEHVLAGPVHRDGRHPYTVDSVLLLQMAAPRRTLAHDGSYADLFGRAPVSGPVALTHTRHDRATGLWHLLAERRRGIGTAGLRTAAVDVHHTRLHAPERPYMDAELHHRLVAVNASRVYRGGFWTFPGAHSDLWHPETAHLLLSLMEQAREATRTGGLPANAPDAGAT